MVSKNARPSNTSPHSASFRFKNAFPTIQIAKRSPTVSEDSTFCSHHIGHSFAYFGLPKEIEVILAAWKSKTTVKYKSFIATWKIFCIWGSEYSALKFSYYLYKNGCCYPRLSSACSVLSTIVHIEGYSKPSDHPLISEVMKSIYNQHPNLPRYVNIWGH